MTHALAGRKQSPEHVSKRVETLRANGVYARKSERQRKPGSEERARQYTIAWRLRNPEKVKAHKRKFQEANRAHRSFYERTREAMKLNATPPWADRDAIAGMYELCGIFRRAGLDLHVDHIVPLKSRSVCGLHVAENLQLLHATANMQKKNRIVGEERI